MLIIIIDINGVKGIFIREAVAIMSVIESQPK